MEDITDQALLAAVRKRLMDEIAGGRSSEAERIVNNVYGAMPAGGLTERLYQGEMGGEDPYEYLVDIDREDVRDPETGEKTGWKKRVRRYRERLGGGEDPTKKKAKMKA